MLSVSPATLTENGGKTTVTVEAELDGAVESSDVTVTLSLSGTAGSGDYTVSTLRNITIPKGVTSKTETFDFTPTPDTVDEGDETITVGGTASGGLDLDSADITITDDPADVASTTVVLSADVASISEDSSTDAVVTVTATLSGTVSRSVPTVVDSGRCAGRHRRRWRHRLHADGDPA